jgi:hypothetical protein
VADFCDHGNECEISRSYCGEYEDEIRLLGCTTI